MSHRQPTGACRGAIFAISGILVTLAACGCGEAAESRVEIPLQLSGSDIARTIATPRGARVTLSRAELAFGPLYLCAGEQAGELCENARLEWLDAAVVDCLDATPVKVGTLLGVTGPLRSYMYDLGFSSLLTHEEPLELDAARKLGGASLRLEGLVALDAREVPFAAKVVVRQGAQVERGVPVIRKSVDDRFEHTLTGSEKALTVRFDPTSWVTGIDFEVLLGEACLDEAADCAGPAVVSEGSQAERSVLLALSAGARPDFDWEQGP